MNGLAGSVVTAFALAMIVMALLGVIAPERLRRMLRLFASSARAHYVEILVRVVIGWSFVVYAPAALSSDMFRIFGWLLVLTSAAMLLVPWQWHQRFAALVVPFIARHTGLYALAGFLLGAIILYGVVRPFV